MTCFTPLSGWRAPNGTITFKRANSIGQGMTVKCGQCSGCRMDHAQGWAVRCIHEEMLDPGNSAFVTLTYNPSRAPTDGGLVHAHHTAFMKALRDRVSRPIRFFMCGEYGAHGPGHHPHYHYLIFGHAFGDREYKTTVNGNRYYVSEMLQSAWDKGFSIIGDVTVESAGYVARYLQKKITGEKSDDHYQAYCWARGREVPVNEEFIRMSNRPGIGKRWFDKFGIQDCYKSGDGITIDGRHYQVPRYYDKLAEEVAPDLIESIKQGRKDAHKLKEETWQRLAERHRIFDRRIEKLQRSMESGQLEDLRGT